MMFWKQKIIWTVDWSTVTKRHKCQKVWWIYGIKGFVRVKKKKKQDVNNDLSVCILNIEFVSEKIKIKRKNLKPLQSCFIRNFFVIFHRGKNFRELDHRLSLTEAAIEMFLENSCMLYDTQIVPLNIVLWRSSSA